PFRLSPRSGARAPAERSAAQVPRPPPRPQSRSAAILADRPLRARALGLLRSRSHTVERATEVVMSAASAPQGRGSAGGAPNLPAGFTDMFASRYIDTGEVRLHAVIGGDGPPLLLVHGWPETWYAWRFVMPALARDFEVVAVDQRGIGLSDKPENGYDTGTLANDLVALMDALGHTEFAVYGTDIGMPIAYALAADHPDRVVRLVVS